MGIRRKVGERWFWRGALRGRSPCTREGRRPDRHKNRESGVREPPCSPHSGMQNDCGCVVTSDVGSKWDQELAIVGRRGKRLGGRRNNGDRADARHPNGSSSVCSIQNSSATITFSLGRLDLSIDAAILAFPLQQWATTIFETTRKSSGECATAPLSERDL